jgi:hypothetical protein
MAALAPLAQLLDASLDPRQNKEGLLYHNSYLRLNTDIFSNSGTQNSSRREKAWLRSTTAPHHRLE